MGKINLEREIFKWFARGNKKKDVRELLSVVNLGNTKSIDDQLNIVFELFDNYPELDIYRLIEQVKKDNVAEYIDYQNNT